MRKGFLLVFAGFLAAAFMAASVSYAGTTEIVSVDSNGKPGNSGSNEPSISSDGRFVAFHSFADNLVPDDTNGMADVFIHDRQTGKTEIISKDSSGKLGNNHSDDPAISADGRFAAFHSGADNLVPGDTNGMADVFVHDKQTGATEIISKDSSGKLGNNHSDDPAISADGRFAAFRSGASNLVPGDKNGMTDIFVHDRQTGKTKLISKNSAGELGNNDSSEPAISANGRYVVFRSFASNLVKDDTNNKSDVFVHDIQTGKTKLISKDSAGILGNNDSSEPAISADGRYVAFRSWASNLVPGDTNGKSNIFVHDRKTGETKIISKGSDGKQAKGPSSLPSISADGRFVAFLSGAGNLVQGDTNGMDDAFVHDRQTGKTEIISVDSAGNQGKGGGCFIPVINADGRFVAFESEADNLVPGDTNGTTDVFVRVRGASQ
ncbi:MAG: cell wall-binding protein [Nitrospirae bacterium]|nr:MAG: cell wall-binding protein [Nitrospirota bacterium]